MMLQKWITTNARAIVAYSATIRIIDLILLVAARKLGGAMGRLTTSAATTTKRTCGRRARSEVNS